MQLKEDLEREEDDVLDRDETDDELEVQLQSANFVFRQLLELAQVVDYADEAGRRAMSARVR